MNRRAVEYSLVLTVACGCAASPESETGTDATSGTTTTGGGSSSGGPTGDTGSEVTSGGSSSGGPTGGTGSEDSSETGSGDSSTGVIPVCEAGSELWAYPAQDAASPPVAGLVTLASLDAGGGSVLRFVDAETGDVTETFELTGDDAPDRAFYYADQAVDTATFVTRDGAGRSFIMNTPSGGDETSISTQIYRYEADGTKTWTFSVADSVHTDWLLRPDGQGGALALLYREPEVGDVIVAVDADGTSAWELVGAEIGAFVLDGDIVWVAGGAEIASYDLGTGDEVGLPISLESDYDGFAIESVGVRSGGFFIGGWLDGPARILGVSTAGDVEWELPAAAPLDREWAMGIAALPDGTGACAVVPTEEGREQHLVCATAAGEQTLVMEALPTDSEGGLSLDDAGNIYVGFAGEFVKLCGSF